MVDDPAAGRRPIVRQEDGRDVPTDRSMAVCPGAALGHATFGPDVIEDLVSSWGPVLELWEGHASDPTLRHSASSGGAATALAEMGLESGLWEGVLHIRARQDAPLLNETVRSRSSRELREAVGSRYAPASPGDRLDLIREADGTSLFMGKPCDVAGVSRLAQLDPLLREKLSGTIAIFCAGTPTLQGTFEMLQQMGVNDPTAVTQLRYRGNGWPGQATATIDTASGPVERQLTYDESWGGVLQRHRQWRCYVCADHTGEFADIAVGDPWYREISEDEPGRSLIVVRTERGRRMLAEAIGSGAIAARPVPWQRLPESQPGLRKVRGAVWGRITASRLFGVASPRYEALPTFSAWRRELTFREKLQSTLGLVRRIRRRGLWERHPVEESEYGA